MPVYSVFANWRGLLSREKKKREWQNNEDADGKEIQAGRDDEKKQMDIDENVPKGQTNRSRIKNTKYQKPNHHHRQDALPPLPEPKTPLTTAEIDELLSLGPSWKKVKAHCTTANAGNENKHSNCWLSIAETMAKEYNQSLAEFYSKKDEGLECSLEEGEKRENRNGRGDCDGVEKGGIAAALPRLFQIREEDKDGISGESGNEKCSKDFQNTFYICACIGESNDG